MKILVLGSGAGGGFPQWNCHCTQCAAQRDGSRPAQARTQSSIAVSPDGENWVLLNASPDIGTQLRQSPALHPREGHGKRHTPIQAVVLMDAQIDHVTGLLSLREGPPIRLYCTPCVEEDLSTGLPLLNVLKHYAGVHLHRLPIEGAQTSADFRIDGIDHLAFRAVAIPGKAPPYSPHRNDPQTGDNIALFVTDTRTGQRLFYAPGLGDVGPQELDWLSSADCVMVDGTFWTEDEMITAGLGTKPAASMGHLPQSNQPGRPGMIAVLDGVPARRKVLIHINNSNPILLDDSEQRQTLALHGIEVAFDGMEIEL